MRFLILLFIISCSNNYNNSIKGNPNKLINISAEKISFSINDKNSTDNLIEWVNDDQPTAAELHCKEGSKNCLEVSNAFNMFAVDYNIIQSNEEKALLIYERVQVSDCNNQYLDPNAFGCSIGANIAKMAGNPRYFIQPPISDLQDGNSAATTYEKYLAK